MVYFRSFRAANQADVDAYYRRNGNRSGYTGYTSTDVNRTLGNMRLSDSYLAEAALDADQDRNPKFHPAITARGAAGGNGAGGLIRGRLVQVAQEPTPMPGAGGGPAIASRTYRRIVQFLYNPTAINMSYSFDESQYPPVSQGMASLSTPTLGGTGQSLSWQLYFNRMYEVAENTEHMGVLADVQALEYLMGSHSGVGLNVVQVMAVFGNTPALKPFAFTGHIANLDVNYVQFSYRMIPTVAMVDITLVRKFTSSTAMITSEVATALADPTTPQAPMSVPGGEEALPKTERNTPGVRPRSLSEGLRT
jgi:hypothetical protein